MVKFIDLMAGIGGMRLAFEQAGADCVFCSEIDEKNQKVISVDMTDESSRVFPVGDVEGIFR